MLFLSILSVAGVAIAPRRGRRLGPRMTGVY